MKTLNKLLRKKDSVWVRPWEDRDTPNYKGWALGRLAWCVYINKKPHSHVRKFWNQSLDHRTIALLAIKAYSIKEDPKNIIKKLSEPTTDDCVFR